MDPLEVQSHAAGRQVPSEAPEEGVVPPASPDGVANGGVVDLEDRTRVVAQVRTRPRSKITRSATPFSSSRSCSARRLRAASPTGPWTLSRISRPPRSVGRVRSISRISPDTPSRRSPTSRPTMSRRDSVSSSGHPLLVGDPRGLEQRSVERAVANADPVARQARSREGLQSQGDHLCFAIGPGLADQLDPGLEVFAGLDLPLADRPVRVREIAEPDRDRALSRTAPQPSARSGSSCRTAAPARGRGRRASGSRRRRRAGRPARAPPRTRGSESRPRRSRRHRSAVQVLGDRRGARASRRAACPGFLVGSG